MAYKHILVAVDLSEDSPKLVNRTATLAKEVGAKMSLIYIDVNYAELYTGLIDINLSETQHRVTDEAKRQLEALAKTADYPISHTLVGSGDLCQEINGVIDEYNIELVVCGHHHDFWSKLLSSTRELLHNSPVDLLIVPLDEYKSK